MTAGKSTRVLIVEDEVLLAMMAKEIVEDAGFEVVAVISDGRAAVDAAIDYRPDVVLMDVRLAAGTSGVEAAVEIFAKTGVRSLFVTATGDAGIRIRAESARPLGWLSKPYVPVDLIKCLRAVTSTEQGLDRLPPLQIKVDSTQRLVSVRACGIVRLQDMFHYFDALAAAGAMPLGKLFDARELDSRLSEEDLQALGVRVRANAVFDPRGAIAAVATTRATKEAVQRFKDLGGATRPIEIFDTIEAGKAWLASLQWR